MENMFLVALCNHDHSENKPSYRDMLPFTTMRLAKAYIEGRAAIDGAKRIVWSIRNAGINGIQVAQWEWTPLSKPIITTFEIMESEVDSSLIRE